MCVRGNKQILIRTPDDKDHFVVSLYLAHRHKFLHYAYVCCVGGFVTQRSIM